MGIDRLYDEAVRDGLLRGQGENTKSGHGETSINEEQQRIARARRYIQGAIAAIPDVPEIHYAIASLYEADAYLGIAQNKDDKEKQC